MARRGRPAGQRQIVPPQNIRLPRLVRYEVWRLEEQYLEFQDTENLFRWLAERGLLRNENMCHFCGTLMTFCNNAQAMDGKIWRCNGCNFKLSVRHQSWFDKSHLSLKQVTLLLYMWIADFSQERIAHELHMHKNTPVHWCNFIREVCEQHLLGLSEPIGGADEQTGHAADHRRN